MRIPLDWLGVIRIRNSILVRLLYPMVQYDLLCWQHFSCSRMNFVHQSYWSMSRSLDFTLMRSRSWLRWRSKHQPTPKLSFRHSPLCCLIISNRKTCLWQSELVGGQDSLALSHLVLHLGSKITAWGSFGKKMNL